MARITFRNLDEYALKLSRLGKGMPEVVGEAIYAGAEIVADEIKANLNNLKSIHHTESMAAANRGEPAFLTNRMKQGLIDSFGVSKMVEKNGYYDVKLGFDGYNNVKTKKFPQGQPNNLIARACESGSSAMIKQPFVRPAVAASRDAAEKKMAEIIDAGIKKKMEV